MIITIDGPAAAGKGTVSKVLADRYQLAYFDTGMIYRAVGLEMVMGGYDISDEQKALFFAQHLTFEKMMALSTHKDFRTDIGSQAASKVSAMPSVRQALLKMQQDFALNPVFADGRPAKGVIYDGRDTGTVVCPQADVKIFVTASMQVRAMRRYNEFVAKGIDTTYQQVLDDMISRDKRDSERKVAPMKPADDAFVLDTSDMDAEAEIKAVIDLVEEKMNLK